LPRTMVPSDAQVPALVRVRVSPAVPQELSTIRRCFSWGGAFGASQVLRRLSSGMPRPEDSGGPSHPCQNGCSCVAFGVRENPRRPQQAPFRSCTSTSGCAVTPAAYRIRCLRFAHLVRRVSTTPPWAQGSLRVDGYSLPDRDFHPARDAKLSWRDNAPAELRPTAENARNSHKSLRCGPSAPVGCYAGSLDAASGLLRRVLK